MAEKPIIKIKRDMRKYFVKAGLNLTFDRRLTMIPTINTANIFDIKMPAPPFIILPDTKMSLSYIQRQVCI